jgi:esterase/lipase
VVLSRHARRAARRLRRPALLVQSLTDESVRPQSATKLARLLGPNTQLLWLKHSRHNALLDRERSLIHDALLARLQSA